MIIGIGIDLIEHERIKNLSNAERFIKKHFTPEEQNLFKTRTNRAYYKTVANCFAAKEAFSKALGTGVTGFNLNDIEVLRNERGKPYINLYNEAKSIFERNGGKNIFVSITDTDVYSSATVVIEGI